MHMGSVMKIEPVAGLWNSSVEIQIHFVYCSGIGGSHVALLWLNCYKAFYENFENYT